MSLDEKGLARRWREERKRARKAEKTLEASDRRVAELQRAVSLAVVTLGRSKNHPALLEHLNAVLEPALIPEPMGRGNVYCITHKVHFGLGGICRKCIPQDDDGPQAMPMDPRVEQVCTSCEGRGGWHHEDCRVASPFKPMCSCKGAGHPPHAPGSEGCFRQDLKRAGKVFERQHLDLPKSSIPCNCCPLCAMRFDKLTALLWQHAEHVSDALWEELKEIIGQPKEKGGF